MEKNKFHSLSYEKIITKFESSTQGLTTDVVTLRQKRDGLNVLKAKKKESVLLIILSQFKEPMTIILLIAAIFGFISEGLG
jgi:magnesium-transporting ATPase (P-type)